MLWTLLAIVISGLGAAGIAMLLRKLSGNRLPKWVIPLSAGLGMLSYQIYYEYSWFDHQRERQPTASIIVSQEAGQVFWRPWSYYWPMITAFTVLDLQSLQKRHLADQPIAVFNLYRFEKQHIDRVSHQAHLLNCASAELLPLDTQQQPLLQHRQVLDRASTLFRQACSSDTP